jgi:hypothetical protein
MRFPRLLLAVVLATAGWALAAPAVLAGGWATTLLDPLPDRIEANQPYTVGFWVLQHGSHPANPPVAEAGLRFTDEKGTALKFKGTALPEPAHYAAAILLPHDGAWQVEGLQGWFAPYKVGTLSVPGGLAFATPPPAMHFDGDENHHSWGAIHPPNMATDTHSAAAAAHPGQHNTASTQSVSLAGSDGPSSPVGFLIAGSLGLLAGFGLAMAGRRLAARGRT